MEKIVAASDVWNIPPHNAVLDSNVQFVESFEPKVYLLDKTKILVFFSDEVLGTFSRIVNGQNNR